MDVDPARRIGEPRHVTDRHGHVWRVVRDGGMLTRADDHGIITLGIAAAELQVGPLTPFPPPMKPDRWWRVTGPAGAARDTVWCETSDEAEARRSVRPGDRLLRLYSATTAVATWREAPHPATDPQEP